MNLPAHQRLGAFLFFMGFAPVPATAQNVLLDGLLGGANGDSTVQCIELRFQGAADRGWGPQGGEFEGRARLAFMDARGNTLSEFVFPSDPPLGVEDPDRGGFSVLVATQAFVDLNTGTTPDFIIPPNIIGDSGKLCFTDNPDNSNHFDVHLCIAYGNFVADPEDATGLPAAALPIVNARMLKRTDNFDQWSEQSNADFNLQNANPRNSAGNIGSILVESEIIQGETLFSRETFQGNGRTCLTCHRPEDQFGLTPETIALLPADDPLFIAEINPALAALEDPCLMNDGRALILENIDGFEAPPVFRSSPHLLNLALTAPYGLSGEFENLRVFTTGAVQQHFPRTMDRNSDPAEGPMDFRMPTEEELIMMEAFQLSLKLPSDGNYDLDRMILSAVERGADAASIEAGRDLFLNEAKCTRCHGGTVLAEVDPLLDSGNVNFNTGTVNVTDNDFLDCLDGPMPPEAGGDRRFSVPSLIGISLTAPFFHDSSAETLSTAVAFYGLDIFNDSPAGILVDGIELTSGERDDIVAFLEALVEPNKVHNLTQVTGFNSIQEALAAADDGDEIVVDPGIYLENLDFGDISVDLHSVAPLDPAVVAATVLDGGGLAPVVIMDGGTVSGFTIRNGASAGPFAGGVEASGTSIVSHNVIMNNTADQRGGGVSAVDFTVVHNNRIVDNFAGNRAGGISARDNSLVINNVIMNNNAPIGGGGVRAQENALIRNNTIIFNQSEETGSGVQGGGGILAEDNATLINNIVAFSSDGVGIHAAEDSTVTANYNCVFGNVDGDYSGNAVPGANDVNADPQLDAEGLHLLPRSPCINVGDPVFISLEDEFDVDLDERVVDGRIEIGADEARRVWNVTRSRQYMTIQEAINDAVDGEALVASVRTYFENLDFLGKDISLSSVDPQDFIVVATTIIDGGNLGAAVRMSAGELTGFTITRGLSGDGGGVHATGTAGVVRNFITGNNSTTDGGGVFAGDDAEVRYNLIVGNTANQRGGGVAASEDAVVINNKVGHNSASAGGGGIHTSGSPLIRNNTIVFNSSNDSGQAPLGGGGLLASGSPEILNNIIAFSTNGADLHANPGDDPLADYNCVFGGADGQYGGIAVAGPNDINQNPLLEGDEIHVADASPCIQAGDPGTILQTDETDIDGEARIQNGVADIGADETALAACDGDANGDRSVDPLDTGYILARFGCPVDTGNAECDVADANTDGIVDPLDVGFALARFGDCP